MILDEDFGDEEYGIGLESRIKAAGDGGKNLG